MEEPEPESAEGVEAHEEAPRKKRKVRYRQRFAFGTCYRLWKQQYFWRKHWFLASIIQSVLIFGFLGILVCFPIAKNYYDKASAFDAMAVSEFQNGGLVLDANGDLMGSLADDGRILVRYDQFPKHLIQALMAAEDSRFYEHRGFDAQGILRAVVANVQKQKIDQGGSTITQQLARNSCDLGGRDIHRKLIEIFFAVRIEREFTKEEILTHYLNRIYFGSGFHGIGSAAKGYFNKDTEELTAAECAMICGLIRRPQALSPFNDLKAAEGAKERVLNRMVELGYIDPATAESPDFRQANVVRNQGRNNRPRYLLSAVRREANKLVQGQPPAGLVVETSINQKLQNIAEAAVSTRLNAIETKEGTSFPHATREDFLNEKISEPDYLQGAALILENRTGKIVSAVCSRDHFESEYDRISLSKRPSGTAFLPFVYAAAFETEAANPAGTTYDAPIDNREVMLGGTEGILGEWGTETTSRNYLGEIPVGYGLVLGANAATVRVGFDTGLERVHELAFRAGITSELPEFPSMFLGSGEITLRELTHAYTTFPNGGIRTEQTGVINKITTRDGVVLYKRPQGETSLTRAFSKKTAGRIDLLLKQAIRVRADGESMKTLSELKGPFAAMSGTSWNYENNWFVGFNDQYTWGVWVGMDIPKPIYDKAFSKDTALPIWADLAKELDTGTSALENLAQKGTLVPICVDSCSRAHKGCREAGHRYLTLEDDGSFDSLPFCKSGMAFLNEEDKEKAKSDSSIRAVPLHADSRQPGSGLLPVVPDMPPLMGDNAYGILDYWEGQ